MSTTLSPASVKQLGQMNFEVYPNPATTSVNVVLENDQPATLDIYNLTGGKVQSIILSKKETIISTEGFSKGSYFFKLSKDSGVQTKKIVIE